MLFWLSACEKAGSCDFAFVGALEIRSLRLRLRLDTTIRPRSTRRLFHTPVLLKLWAAARQRAAEVWLPGRGSTPKFVICIIIREYGTAFILTLSLKIS